jgi:decaprenyl-phosphate phosphoribosyltransferase
MKTSKPSLSKTKSSNIISAVASCIAALRPRQWTKNLVVFAAPLFAFSINVQSLLNTCLALILFCAASSGFYLINDIADVESDRQHPVKCKRPIAAGLVSIPVAWTMAIVLLGGALVVGWWKSPALGATISAYAVLQLAYNLRLKRMVILDIGAIATGFVLRAYAGAAATGIILSSWFILCTAMLALFLAIEKRKAELRLAQIKGVKPRAVLKRYSLALLNRMENVVTTSTVVSYALWSAGPAVQGATTSWMLLTLPFVLYGIFRYQLLSDPTEIASVQDSDGEHGGRSERPEEVLLKDMHILLTVGGWVITCFAILWLKSQRWIY